MIDFLSYPLIDFLSHLIDFLSYLIDFLSRPRKVNY